MGINPRDYDLDELRKMARERERRTDGGDVDEPDLGALGLDDDVAAGNSMRSELYREHLLLAAGADDVSKPYLASIPDHHAGEYVVFEWLEFLLLHTGYRGAVEALDYYESIDWITEEVESDLDDYLMGIDDQAANEDNELDVDDHLLSLTYISKLASVN